MRESELCVFQWRWCTWGSLKVSSNYCVSWALWAGFLGFATIKVGRWFGV